MKEAYVSFEVAKLLKKKGFNIPSDTSYEDYLWQMYDENGKVHWGIYNNDWYFRITQQMAMRWLREVHNIDISVTPDDGSWWIKVTELEYWSGVFNGKVLNSDDIKFAYNGSTSTKEECYEAGLQYVLTNLI